MSESKPDSGLKKQLTFLDVFSLAAGAMISSGIFILPGMAFALAGPSMIISYMLAGILALAGVFSVAELSTAMPKAGGNYYYVNRSMGPVFGTISGLNSWFALSLKTSFAIFGIAEVVYLMTGLPVIPVSIIICILFVGLNIFGVKEAAKLEVWLVVALLFLMGVYVFTGFSSVQVERFDPFIFGNYNSVLLTAGFVFVSFGGLLNVTSVAEEVKNPQRNIPFGMISAVLVVTLMYALLLVVTVGVLPSEELQGSLTPLADAARIFAGKPGYYAITIAAMLAFITTANAGIMSASRYPLALSRDNLLPAYVSKINVRFDTPVRAIIVTGCFIILSFFLPLEMLVKSASTVVLTSYVLANLSIIILRESKLQNYRPSFRAPFYPWLQIMSIIILLFLIVEMGMATVEISLGLILTALLTYFFYGKKRSKSEYAWLHLIARMGNEQLDSYNLESELKNIIHRRDDVVKDRFDQLVSTADVVDLDQSMDKNTLFELLAEHLSKKLSLSREEILTMIHEREAQGSTVLNSFVAIPHIMVKGENVFEVMLIRCLDGVAFDEDAPSLKAIFLIIGSRDERKMHLQALAAIAQTIQEKEFSDRWRDARSESHLRDVFLLSKRQRY